MKHGHLDWEPSCPYITLHKPGQTVDALLIIIHMNDLKSALYSYDGGVVCWFCSCMGHAAGGSM